MKLLIVEDDIAYAQSLTRRLSKQGFEIECVTKAQDVLLCARNFMPSHVLMDMKLDSENSLSLVKPLRSLLPDAQIVLLTGFASIATAVEAIRLGASDYLAKPADTKTILASLIGQKAGQKNNIDLDEEPISSEQLEWEHIQQVLKSNSGNVSETARQLGMHRRTLQRKLQKKPQLTKLNHDG